MPKRRLLKRILLAFATGAALVLLGLAGLVLVLRHRYPPEKLGALVAQLLSERLHRPVSIGRTSFHLLRGFQLDSIAVARNTESQSALDSLFIRRVVLRYSPRALLHRRLSITRIGVEEPTFCFALAKSRRQQERQLAPQATPRPSSDKSLPLALAIHEVSLTGATVQVTTVDSAAYEARATGLNLVLRGLATRGRHPAAALKGVRFELASHDGQLSLRRRSGTPSLTSRLELDCVGAVDSASSGALRLRLRLAEAEFVPFRSDSASVLENLLLVEAEGPFAATDSTVTVTFRPLELRLVGSEPLTGETTIRLAPKERPIALRLYGGQISLAPILDLTNRLAKKDLPPELSTARLSLPLLDLRGDLNQTAFSLTLQAEFQSPRLSMGSANAVLDSVQAGTEIRARFASGHLAGLEAELTAIAPSGTVVTRRVSHPLRNLTLEAACRFDSTLWPETAHLHYEIQHLLGGFLYVQSQWRTPGRRTSVRGAAEIEINGLRISRLTPSVEEGKFDLRASVRVPGDGSVQVTGTWSLDSLLIPHPIEPILLAPRRGQLHAIGTFDAERAEAVLAPWEFSVPGQVGAQGQARFAPGVVDLRIDSAALFIGPIYSWLRPLLSKTAQAADLGGDLALKAQFLRRGGKTEIGAQVRIQNGLVSRRDVGFAIGEISVSGRLAGDLEELRFSGSGLTDSIWIANLGDSPLRNVHFRTAVLVDLPARSLRIDSAEATQEPLQLQAHAQGWVDMSRPEALASRIEYVFDLSPEQFVPVGDRFALSGPASGTGIIALHGDTLDLAGTFLPRGCNVALRSATLRGIWGMCHYQYTLLRQEPENVFLPLSGGSLPEIYGEDFRWETGFRPELDTLFVSEIEAGEYRLQGLRTHLRLSDGMVLVPYFEVGVYGGRVGGNLLYDMRGRTSRKGAVVAEVQAGRISSAVLIGRQPERHTLVSATVLLRGSGLEPDDLPYYSGWIDFSRIGREVADDLLRHLDPAGTNRGIQTTRRLLGLGFRPTRMRFELRDGYFYPEIVLRQPWYSPVRLSGGRIEMGRIPLELFVRQYVASRKIRAN